MSKAIQALGAFALASCVLFALPKPSLFVLGLQVVILFSLAHGLPLWGLVHWLRAMLRPLDKRLSTTGVFLGAFVFFTFTCWAIGGPLPLWAKALKTSMQILGVLCWAMTPQTAHLRPRPAPPFVALGAIGALAIFTLWADTTHNLTALALKAKSQGTRVVATLVEPGVTFATAKTASQNQPGAGIVGVFPASDSLEANVVTTLTGWDPYQHGVRTKNNLNTPLLNRLSHKAASQGPLWVVDTQGAWAWANHLSSLRGPCQSYPHPLPRWVTNMALDTPAAWEAVLTPWAPCAYNAAGPQTPVLVRHLQLALRRTPQGETTEVVWLMDSSASPQPLGWKLIPKVSSRWPTGVVDLGWLALAPYPEMGGFVQDKSPSPAPLLLPLGALRAWTLGRPPPQMAYGEGTSLRQHPAQFVRTAVCAHTTPGGVDMFTWDPVASSPTAQTWLATSPGPWAQESLAPCNTALVGLVGHSLETDISLFEKGPQYALRFRQYQERPPSP